jgi:drug/metabolite transporter (DMT)-like permease
MSIVAPLSAVLAAGIPVLLSAFLEGLPQLPHLLGFGVAFVSIALLSSQKDGEAGPAGIGLAMLAGLGFGAFFTALDQISDGAVFWPLVAGRLVSVAVMSVFALSTRRALTSSSPPLGLLALAGVLDVAGNYFFLLAVQTGRLDVAAVLVSLYPAVTAFLAMLIAHERLSRLQAVGAALAVVAIALITV